MFLGFELIRELSFYDLKKNVLLDHGALARDIIMVDSDTLIFCSRLLLVGCQTTLVFFFFKLVYKIF